MKKEALSQLISTKKHAGETLAVFLERVREEYSIPAGVPMTYAGRLDPMAHGEMLVLWGEACKEKDAYLGRSKEYKVQILLGVGTDTGDMLGLVTESDFVEKGGDEIAASVTAIHTITALPYPAYSSKTVDGVPLWVHARDGVDMAPIEKDVVLSDVVLLGIQKSPLCELIDQKVAIIQNIVGDFRQKEIIDAWEKIKNENPMTEVRVVTIRLTCTSGAYMRSLAEKVGEMLSTPALAYDIERLKIIQK